MICDAHVHVGQLNDVRTPRNFSSEEIVRVLKKHNVSKFIFSSMNAQTGAPYSVIEKDAILVKELFGAGAYAFFWLTGRFFDADSNLSVLDSGLWDGVKIHELETPWVKEHPKDLEHILDILEGKNIPVQFHTGEDKGCYPHELLPFIKRHSRLRVDFAHCRPCDETIECLKQCPNLFTDTAFMPPKFYEKLVKEGVDNRVMFGTDLPIQGGYSDEPISNLYENDLKAARDAKYSELVMSENFHRFLGL